MHYQNLQCSEIQGTGKLFCQKIGPPICSLICWEVFANFGGGLLLNMPNPLRQRFRLRCSICLPQ